MLGEEWQDPPAAWPQHEFRHTRFTDNAAGELEQIERWTGPVSEGAPGISEVALPVVPLPEPGNPEGAQPGFPQPPTQFEQQKVRSGFPGTEI